MPFCLYSWDESSQGQVQISIDFIHTHTNTYILILNKWFKFQWKLNFHFIFKCIFPKPISYSKIYQHQKIPRAWHSPPPQKEVSNWIHIAESSQKSENRQRVTLVYGTSIGVGAPSLGLCLPHVPQGPVHIVIPSSHFPALPAHSNPPSTDCLQSPIAFIWLPVSI